MKGVFLLIAVVVFATLQSEVNGQAAPPLGILSAKDKPPLRERLAGEQLVNALDKKTSSIQCYVCSGCSDNSAHISDADLKPCTGEQIDPATVRHLGLAPNPAGPGYTVPAYDLCTATPDDLACYVKNAEAYAIKLTDPTDLAKCKSEYAIGIGKITADAKQLLTKAGPGFLYHRPLCSISFGEDKKVTMRNCNPRFIIGLTTQHGLSNGVYGGTCGEDFKLVKTNGGTVLASWCSCPKDKCNGGSFAKPSVAALVFSFVLATFVYGKNQF